MFEHIWSQANGKQMPITIKHSKIILVLQFKWCFPIFVRSHFFLNFFLIIMMHLAFIRTDSTPHKLWPRMVSVTQCNKLLLKICMKERPNAYCMHISFRFTAHFASFTDGLYEKKKSHSHSFEKETKRLHDTCQSFQLLTILALFKVQLWKKSRSCHFCCCCRFII